MYLLELPVCLVTKLPAGLESFSDVNCSEDEDCSTCLCFCWIKKCVNLM